MEERHSLVNHKRSFKTQGLREFSEKVLPYIDKTIDRKVAELESLKQIVSKYKGKEVKLVTTADSADDYNGVTLQIIDWNEEKSKGLAIYKRFLNSPFTTDYIPFGYQLRSDGEE